jgi:DNA topoisomerase-1
MPPKRFYRKSGAPSGASAKKSPPAHKNAKWLVIVESPSKCAKIEEYLSTLDGDPNYGGGYQCIASRGHIRTIDGLKSINTKTDFAPTFTLIDGKSRHVNEMREIIARYPKENVLIATDDDREGEAIGWHICMLFGLPIETTKRILFHEITQTAICDAVRSPTTINMSLVYAQHSRQILDIVVGFTISPILWKHIYNDKLNGLSAGRCQTPALRLIYDHAQTYRDHVATERQYKTTGTFFDKNIRFELSRTHDTEAELLSFLDKSKTHRHTLEIMPMRETTKSPPRPFTTSRLLQSASSALRFSPKKTMELCQLLYQSGRITYMRTDSSKYSPVFLQHATAYIMGEWGDPRYIGNTDALENRDAGNPHEAIRVTNIRMTHIADADKALVSMYRFIWKNTIESCMSVAKYNSRLVKISAPCTPDRPLYYGYTLEIPVFLGWKKISAGNAHDGGDDTEGGGASAVQQTGLQFYFESLVAAPVRVNYIESRVITERAGQHYTEATLIQKLEELGIGRPSTYASIVDTIQERGYVKKTDVKGITLLCAEYKLRFGAIFAKEPTLEKTEIEKVFGHEKNKLVIQPTGIIVLEFLLNHFEQLFSYNYTKNMERDLDVVSESDATKASETWNVLCRDCYQLIKQLKKPLAKLKKETYALDKNAELVFHSSGASIKYTNEDGTTEYRSVKKNIDIDLGKLKNGEYSAEELLEIPEEHLGVFLGNAVLLKSGRYGLYAECGETKVSLKTIQKPADTIVLADILPFLVEKEREKHALSIIPGEASVDDTFTYDDTSSPVNTRTTTCSDVAFRGSCADSAMDLSAIANTYRDISTKPAANPTIRALTPEMSVRKGKYGAYVYYKTAKMKTPTFLNIKKYKEDCWTCEPAPFIEWIRTTYHIA